MKPISAADHERARLAVALLDLVVGQVRRPPVGHRRHLGPSRLEDNVPAAPDDDLSAGFLCDRDDREGAYELLQRGTALMRRPELIGELTPRSA